MFSLISTEDNAPLVSLQNVLMLNSTLLQPISKILQLLNGYTNKVLLVFLIWKTRTLTESTYICLSYVKHHKNLKTPLCLKPHRQLVWPGRRFWATVCLHDCLPSSSFTLHTVYTAKGIVEGIESAWFVVFLWREVFFHFLDNRYKFFRNSVSILLFTVKIKK